MDQPDGPLLAVVYVEVNGDWEGFYERSVALNKTPTPADGSESTPISGRHDLVIVFTHPGGAGGLMNLDALQF